MNNLELLQVLLNPLVQERIRVTRSYYEFFKAAWKVLEPQTPFIDNWHIKYLCDRLQKEVERIAKGEKKDRDIIINIPPRSLKSSIVTVFLTAWAWLEYPHLKIVNASYSQELSTEHSVKSRRIIESEWYRSLVNLYKPKNGEDVDGRYFELTGDQNVKTKFENSKTGVRYATSVGGAFTGSGADLIIIDDPHKANEIYSEVSRKGVIDWYRNTVSSRLNNQEVGVRIIVMQRLHEEDLTGEMLLTGKYEHINIPAILDSDTTSEVMEYYRENLFFPDRFSLKVLEDLRASMGAREFVGQYLQKPSPDDGDIIKKEWFKEFVREQLPENIIVNYYTDSAYGKEESDNSATIVYSVYNNNLYVWGCYAWNLQFPDFEKRYPQMVYQTGYSGSSRCYFEPKASGISIVQQLKRTTNLNIIEDKPPVESKVSRVTSSSASIEAGRVHLLKNGVGMDQLINEAITFPNGKHDDCIDALSSVIRIELTNNSVSEVLNVRNIF